MPRAEESLIPLLSGDFGDFVIVLSELLSLHPLDGNVNVFSLESPFRGFLTDIVRLALRLLFLCKSALVLLSNFVNYLKSVTSVA